MAKSLAEIVKGKDESERAKLVRDAIIDAMETALKRFDSGKLGLTKYTDKNEEEVRKPDFKELRELYLSGKALGDKSYDVFKGVYVQDGKINQAEVDKLVTAVGEKFADNPHKLALAQEWLYGFRFYENLLNGKQIPGATITFDLPERHKKDLAEAYSKIPDGDKITDSRKVAGDYTKPEGVHAAMVDALAADAKAYDPAKGDAPAFKRTAALFNNKDAKAALNKTYGTGTEFVGSDGAAEGLNTPNVNALRDAILSNKELKAPQKALALAYLTSRTPETGSGAASFAFGGINKNKEVAAELGRAHAALFRNSLRETATKNEGAFTEKEISPALKHHWTQAKSAYESQINALAGKNPAEQTKLRYDYARFLETAHQVGDAKIHGEVEKSLAPILEDRMKDAQQHYLQASNAGHFGATHRYAEMLGMDSSKPGIVMKPGQEENLGAVTKRLEKASEMGSGLSSLRLHEHNAQIYRDLKALDDKLNQQDKADDGGKGALFNEKDRALLKELNITGASTDDIHKAIGQKLPEVERNAGLYANRALSDKSQFVGKEDDITKAYGERLNAAKGFLDARTAELAAAQKRAGELDEVEPFGLTEEQEQERERLDNRLKELQDINAALKKDQKGFKPDAEKAEKLNGAVVTGAAASKAAEKTRPSERKTAEKKKPGTKKEKPGLESLVKPGTPMSVKDLKVGGINPVGGTLTAADLLSLGARIGDDGKARTMAGYEEALGAAFKNLTPGTLKEEIRTELLKERVVFGNVQKTSGIEAKQWGQLSSDIRLAEQLRSRTKADTKQPDLDKISQFGAAELKAAMGARQWLNKDSKALDVQVNRDIKDGTFDLGLGGKGKADPKARESFFTAYNLLRENHPMYKGKDGKALLPETTDVNTAVRAFEKAEGLYESGQVGPEVRGRLKSRVEEVSDLKLATGLDGHVMAGALEASFANKQGAAKRRTSGLEFDTDASTAYFMQAKNDAKGKDKNWQTSVTLAGASPEAKKEVETLFTSLNKAGGKVEFKGDKTTYADWAGAMSLRDQVIDAKRDKTLAVSEKSEEILAGAKLTSKATSAPEASASGKSKTKASDGDTGVSGSKDAEGDPKIPLPVPRPTGERNTGAKGR